MNEFNTVLNQQVWSSGSNSDQTMRKQKQTVWQQTLRKPKKRSTVREALFCRKGTLINSRTNLFKAKLTFQCSLVNIFFFGGAYEGLWRVIQGTNCSLNSFANKMVSSLLIKANSLIKNIERLIDALSGFPKKRFQLVEALSGST